MANRVDPYEMAHDELSSGCTLIAIEAVCIQG